MDGCQRKKERAKLDILGQGLIQPPAIKEPNPFFFKSRTLFRLETEIQEAMLLS